MKKIDLNKILTNLSGVELKNGNDVLTTGAVLADIMLSAKQGNKMKNFVMAQRFFNEKGIIELDESDFEQVKQCVEADEMYGTIVSGQILVELSKA